ncbi:MAG: hypothetical protein QXT86_13810 [Archaeoglobaceae archaeon]
MSVFSIFSDPVNKKDLLLSSIKTKKLLLCASDFNSLADYLFFKKYYKRIQNITEIENYIIGRIKVRIPIRRFWEREIRERELDRFVIFGFDENDKIVCFYSDMMIDIPFSFGFENDVAKQGPKQIELNSGRYRVQGDLVLEVNRVRDVTIDYLNLLFRSSEPVIHNVLFSELYRRISDILGEKGITTAFFENLVIEGCPRNIKIDKLVNYILNNLILSDIFRNYSIEIKSDPYGDRWFLLFSSENNSFIMRISTWIERREERILNIRIDFENTMMTRETPEHIFFSTVVNDVDLLSHISEEETDERIGRHNVHIENALPRHLALDYEFALTKRRYPIILNAAEYVTSGTKIIIEHPEHGKKTLKLPATRFRFLHVNDLYRTTAIKNNLLLHYYFT